MDPRLPADFSQWPQEMRLAWHQGRVAAEQPAVEELEQALDDASRWRARAKLLSGKLRGVRARLRAFEQSGDRS